MNRGYWMDLTDEHQNFRRVIVRYEYYPENYQGFVQLGYLIILLRQYV